MTIYDWQLQKFVMQHSEYAGKLKVGNLGMNVFCDILRKEPKAIIAESDLPHDIEQIGNRLATSWTVIEQRKEEMQRSMQPHRKAEIEL